MTEKRKQLITRIIRLLQSIGEYALIAIILISILIAVYALWDIKFVASKAQPSNYAIYKPGEDKGSWEELKASNSEVIGWINIYGTNIDYPVVQAKDNEKYLMTDAFGRYSLSGAIFLDYRNKADFSDFNNIIHGHSMSHNAMFGDVSDFLDEEFYRTHGYGDLFFSETHHGLKIIAIAEVDAYTSGLYRMVLGRDESADAFFSELDSASKFAIDESDKNADYTYVLLSTCTSAFTNGRHILVCRLTDEVYENAYASDTETAARDTVGGPRVRIRFLLIVLIIIALLVIITKALDAYDKKQREKLETRKTSEN